MAHRWEVARLLEQGLPYLEVAQRTGASTTTVTRVAHWLRHGEGGYRLALDRLEGDDVDRLTIAVPVKGRLREPSVSLLEDAGFGPEQPGDRALAFPCRNAPVDVLLVRADDIPEYVQDGVVDCGITGLDLVRERCDARRRAAAARVRLVPARGRRARRSRAYQRLEDLEGATVATVFPRLTRELMPVPVELVEITGSVEVAPRLGLADAIVDLVSSGNTLRTNGLRSLGTLFSSRGGADRPRGRRRGADRVDDARGRRGARAPLPDAERARGAARRDLRDHRLALAERAAARRGGHGRGARARAGEGRVAAAAASSRRPARRRSWSCPSSGCRDEPSRCGSRSSRTWPKRTWLGRSGYPPPAPMRSSLPAKSRHVSVTEVRRTCTDSSTGDRADGDAVSDRLRDQGRGRRGGPALGARARRRRAGARRRPSPTLLPRDALLALADRVRRWHEAQRPPDVALEVEPGVVLERRWVPLADGRRLRAAEPRLDARHVRRPGAGRGRRAHRRLHAAGRAPASSPPRPSCSGSTRCGRSAGRRRSAGSRTSAASTRSSGPGTRT